MDKTEVTNAAWIEFLWSIRLDSGQAYYQTMLPDSIVGLVGKAFVLIDSIARSSDQPNANELQQKLEIRYGHKIFDEIVVLPIVGISYEQARAFCTWRTRVTRLHANQVNLTFRLPTEDEWLLAASTGLDTSVYAFGYKSYYIKPTLYDNAEYYWKQIRDTTKLTHRQFNTIFQDYRKYGQEPFFNCTKLFLKFFSYGSRHLESAYDKTNRPPKLSSYSVFSENKVEVTSFNFANAVANDLGLSHMIGNAAEMTLTKGIARGGSFAHSLANCKISQRYYYYTTTNWLGFRCVAELKPR